MNRFKLSLPHLQRRRRHIVALPFFALLFVCAALAWGLAACGVFEPDGSCAKCNSDKDCAQGLTCESFTGGHKLCAASTTTYCTVSGSAAEASAPGNDGARERSAALHRVSAAGSSRE